MSKLQTISGKLVYKQFIELADGTEVQVRYNQNPDLYAGTDVTVYDYIATEGKAENKKEVTKYAVAVADAIRASKTSKVDNMLADIASGMSAKDILAKYGKQ